MKRKRIIGVILSLVMLISALPIVTQAWEIKTYGNLKYVTYDDYVEIIGYIGEPTEIEIPSEIDNLPVAHIYQWAFKNCNNLTKIIIPDSIEKIGGSVFEGCDNLTGIYITDLNSWCQVSFSGYKTPLYYAKNLYINDALATDITIPSSVENIKDYAFAYCDNLTTAAAQERARKYRLIPLNMTAS